MIHQYKLKDKPTNILRELSDTKTSTVYLLDDKKTIFKQLKKGENLDLIHKYHPNFLAYVEYLESLRNSALVIPNDIYCYGFLQNKIDSYSYPYIDGLPIYKFPPKINIRKFISAEHAFSEEVRKMDGAITLCDAHAGNILYTGECLKLIDIDFFHEPTKKSPYRNEAIINPCMLKFLLNENTLAYINQYECLQEEYQDCLNGKISVAFFLETIIAFIELIQDREVTYLKDIQSKQLIKK